MFGWGDVGVVIGDLAVEATVVKPIDVAERGALDVVQTRSRGLGGRSVPICRGCCTPRPWRCRSCPRPNRPRPRCRWRRVVRNNEPINIDWNAPITVMDQAVEELAGKGPIPDGHLQGVDSQVRSQAVGDRPAHDHPGVHVENQRGLHPAAVRFHIRQIGNPEPVRGWCVEVRGALSTLLGENRAPTDFAVIADPCDR